jgi:dihydropteroate synthase
MMQIKIFSPSHKDTKYTKNQSPMKKTYILNCGPREFRLHERTHVMGILNVTPDSFSDGGKFSDSETAVAHGLAMERAGADFIDIGGESTRPGAVPVPLEEELRRVVPVIAALAPQLTTAVISIDTYKSEVARQALAAGARVVNDISGLRFDPELKTVVARQNVPVILMHIKGTPRDMQKSPVYGDVVKELAVYLRESMELGARAGIPRENMVIDPGIGFGKTREHNLQILKRLAEFSALGAPMLVGVSRKSFIGLTLDLPVTERLAGSLAAAAVAVQNGAHIVRAHDVAETVRAVKVVDAIKNIT